jgi:hypothetical protein
MGPRVGAAVGNNRRGQLLIILDLGGKASEGLAADVGGSLIRQPAPVAAGMLDILDA